MFGARTSPLPSSVSRRILVCCPPTLSCSIAFFFVPSLRSHEISTRMKIKDWIGLFVKACEWLDLMLDMCMDQWNQKYCWKQSIHTILLSKHVWAKRNLLLFSPSLSYSRYLFISLSIYYLSCVSVSLFLFSMTKWLTFHFVPRCISACKSG